MIKYFCDKCGTECEPSGSCNFRVSLGMGQPIIEKQVCKSCLQNIGMTHPPAIKEDDKQKFFDLMYEVLYKEYGLAM